MLNFNLAKESFEQQALDILKYEIYYCTDIDEVYHNFKYRMTRYLKDEWGLCKPTIKYYLDNTVIKYKVEFPAESTGGVPFGFEYCIDLYLLMKQRYIL